VLFGFGNIVLLHYWHKQSVENYFVLQRMEQKLDCFIDLYQHDSDSDSDSEQDASLNESESAVECDDEESDDCKTNENSDDDDEEIDDDDISKSDDENNEECEDEKNSYDCVNIDKTDCLLDKSNDNSSAFFLRYF
jgi:hypothetical protein